MFYLQQPKQELDPEPPKWSDPKLGPQKGGAAPQHCYHGENCINCAYLYKMRWHPWQSPENKCKRVVTDTYVQLWTQRICKNLKCTGKLISQIPVPRYFKTKILIYVCGREEVMNYFEREKLTVDIIKNKKSTVVANSDQSCRILPDPSLNIRLKRELT